METEESKETLAEQVPEIDALQPEKPSEVPLDPVLEIPGESEKPKIVDLECLSEKFENSSPIPISDNDINRETPSSPRVFVSLLASLKESPKKSYSPVIADSLVERMNITENKISNMRVKQIAEEIGKLRNVPEICEKSRKIMENRIPKSQPRSPTLKTKNLADEKESEDSSFEKILSATRVKENNLDYDLIKESIKIRESIKDYKKQTEKKKEKNTKKMSLTERAKISDEKKKRLEKMP